MTPPVQPRLSIGLPVYNGERFLTQAFDSILGQTFDDFELIISDNASTDRTAEICRDYVAGDARIRYYRNDSNIGVSRNFNRTFEMASGAYFKWCAHDDLMRPDYLEKCVRGLDEHPEAVLCYPHAVAIDDEGNELRYYVYRLRTDSAQPSERFHDLIRYEHPCFQQFGVVRADALRKTPLHEHYSSADRVLIARLALLGTFLHLPDYLHLNREYTGTSVQVYRSRYERMVLYDPAKKGKIVLPYWTLLNGYFRAVQESPLPLDERSRCLLYLGQWAKKRRRKLTKDITLAVKHPLRPLYSRLRPHS